MVLFTSDFLGKETQTIEFESAILVRNTRLLYMLVVCFKNNPQMSTSLNEFSVLFSNSDLNSRHFSTELKMFIEEEFLEELSSF